MTMKKRVLSGIQPSGKLHIGNYFGMIKRMVEYQKSSELFLFIANLHSLTSLQDQKKLKEMTLEAATNLLALGIDPEHCHFWVQSDVPEVTELMWILSCITPMGLMERAHSFKDKVAKGVLPNLGLFCYPTLMTADILINQSDIIPVGKDQKQHIEIARDIAIKFNNQFGKVFTIPKADIIEDLAVIPGIDGQKMSKSYKNTIPIFDSPSVVKKSVMSIVTDSKGVDEVKDSETCNVFTIYKLFSSKDELEVMTDYYKKGKIGYGEAKKILLEKITRYFEPFNEKYQSLKSNPKKVEEILENGAEKVRKITLKTLEDVRKATGLSY